jgi:hypothetical protein
MLFWSDFQRQYVYDIINIMNKYREHFYLLTGSSAVIATEMGISPGTEAAKC